MKVEEIKEKLMEDLRRIIDENSRKRNVMEALKEVKEMK